MRSTAIFAILATIRTLSGGAAIAGEVDQGRATAEVTQLAQRIVAAVNVGDMKSAMALWGEGDHVIIDNFPPFAWNGPDAPAAWLRDFTTEVERNSETDEVVKLGAPVYVLGKLLMYARFFRRGKPEWIRASRDEKSD